MLAQRRRNFWCRRGGAAATGSAAGGHRAGGGRVRLRGGGHQLLDGWVHCSKIISCLPSAHLLMQHFEALCLGRVLLKADQLEPHILAASDQRPHRFTLFEGGSLSIDISTKFKLTWLSPSRLRPFTSMIRSCSWICRERWADDCGTRDLMNTPLISSAFWEESERMIRQSICFVLPNCPLSIDCIFN
jgi:hypothetical protein